MYIIAHRGFNAPEMSPHAYENALALPIHGVECDIRLTGDGHLVCTHDRTMQRVAGDPMAVSTATLHQLKKLNIGTDPVQRILTLDELLDMVLPTDKHLYIETKHPSRAGRMLEEQLVLRLRYRNLLKSKRIHVISFSHVAMRRMRALAPKIETFYLRRDWEARFNPTDIRLSVANMGVSIERAKQDPWLITDNTYMWTVNEPEDMVWARDHGVAVIATDFPDVALQIG